MRLVLTKSKDKKKNVAGDVDSDKVIQATEGIFNIS